MSWRTYNRYVERYEPMKTSLTEVTFELSERKPDIEQTSPNG